MNRAILLFLIVALCCSAVADDKAPLQMKTEHFDHDPGWDFSNNRIEASNPPTVNQDFGWSPGEIGGTVWKSTTSAWYGMPLDKPLSFKDAFSASGKIAVSPNADGGGVSYLGFFNHERQGWRPWSSMAIRISYDGNNAAFFLDFMTAKWAAGAAEMNLTIPADGSQHTWKLDYDPNAQRAPWTDKHLHDYLSTHRQTVDDILALATQVEPGVTRESIEKRLRQALLDGQVNFLHRHGHDYWTLKQEKEKLLGAVSVQIDGGQIYRTFLSENLRNEAVSLDRFGIFNMQLYHGAMTFHVSDLTVNGQKIDLSQDPNWPGHNNRTQYLEQDFQRQNFGYSPETHFAGGKKGEIGGELYNVEPNDPHHGFYADEVGQLTLDDPVHFSGKIAFTEGSTDAGMFFGYFRAADQLRELPPNIPGAKEIPGWPQPNVLGIVVDGPAKVGWYFTPTVAAADRHLFRDKTGVVFLPTRAHRTFNVDYDPTANDGVGCITVALDGEKPFSLPLTREQRKSGAAFDHFGLMTFRRGGKFSTLYFDDLIYTTRNPNSPQHEQTVVKVPYPKGGRKF